MLPPDARTLSGEVDSPQHLAEIHLPAAGWVVPAPDDPKAGGQILLIALQGRLACFHEGLAWHLEPEHHVWLAPRATLTLRAASLRGCRLLFWHFFPTALPEAFRPLLPEAARSPARGPAPLTPSMQALLLALRGCPVAPALRTLWGTAKLGELLTLLLPSPGEEKTSAPARASSATRVVHPAIRAALEFMNAHLGDSIGLPEIAAAAHASPSHLSRLFTAEFGHGPTQRLRQIRLEHAAALLRSGQANVTEAALAAGYASLGQFSRAFAEHHGHPPSALLRASG